MRWCHGPCITLSCRTRTHARTQYFVIVAAVLTSMLIANGVTNIFHWIKIRNSVLSWYRGNFNRNYTKPFHDCSMKTQDWDCFSSLSLTLCVVKLRQEKKLIAKNANLPVSVRLFVVTFLFLSGSSNSYIFYRSEEVNDSTRVARQHLQQHIH